MRELNTEQLIIGLILLITSILYIIFITYIIIRDYKTNFSYINKKYIKMEKNEMSEKKILLINYLKLTFNLPEPLTINIADKILDILDINELDNIRHLPNNYIDLEKLKDKNGFLGGAKTE